MSTETASTSTMTSQAPHNNLVRQLVMHLNRRNFIAIVGAAAAIAAVPGCVSVKGATSMYGLISKMKVVSGQRDALIAILLEGVSGMPGCLSYVVAQDPTDADAVWI